MKTKTFVLSAFALLLASTVLATKLTTMKVTPLEAEKTLVAFESEIPAHFELTVKDLDGTTLYYKKTDQPGSSYQTIFDFEKAGNGSYVVPLRKLSQFIKIQESTA